MTCPISQQIAEHCDDDESMCECGELLEEKSQLGLGAWLECPVCEWSNFKDE